MGIAGQAAANIRSEAPFTVSTLPFRCGVYPGSGPTLTANPASTLATVLDRKSFPRSIRTCSGSPPGGPYGASMVTAARNAARMLSRKEAPGVTAAPHTAFVPASTNHVTHGFTSRPPASTSTGTST